MSSSNCCFLTCIQISQEAGKVVWYSRLFKNFPQFVVIHTVKGFGIVNEAEVDVFLEFSRFSMIQQTLSIWSLVPLPFLYPVWTSEYSWFVLKPSLMDFERNLTSMWIECNCMITLSWINYKPLVSSLNGTYRHSILMPTSKLFIHPPREVLGPHNSPSGWWSLNWTGFSLLR